MKKKLFFLMVALSTLCACSNEDSERLFSSTSTQLNRSISMSKTNYLDSIFRYNSLKDMMEDLESGKMSKWYEDLSIKLLSYKETGESLNEFGNENLLKSSCFPIYDDTAHINSFKLVSYEKAKAAINSDLWEDYLLERQERLAFFSPSDLKIIKMNWLINGQKVSTYALANEKYIVYDDIFTNVRKITIGTPKKAVKRRLTRMKTKSEVKNRCPMSYTKNTIPVIYGKEGASSHAVLYYEIVANGLDNPVEFLGCSAFAHAETSGKVAYDMHIEKVNEKKGVDGYCEWTYAISVDKTHAKITWTGGSYEIVGEKKANSFISVYAHQLGY